MWLSLRALHYWFGAGTKGRVLLAQQVAFELKMPRCLETVGNDVAQARRSVNAVGSGSSYVVRDKTTAPMRARYQWFSGCVPCLVYIMLILFRSARS